MANDPFADPPVQLAQTELQALGVKTVYSEVFPEEPSSYAPAAAAVAGKAPDIVVLGSTDVPTVAAFMQGFQQAHYTPKMFIAAAGPDQGAAFIKAAGVPANAAAMMVPDGWYGGYVNAESEKMVAEYIKEYGGTASDVNADVAEAYSVGQVVEQAINATKRHQQQGDHRLPAQRRHAEHRAGPGAVQLARRELVGGRLRVPVEQDRHRVQPGPADDRPGHEGGDHRHQAGLGRLGLTPGSLPSPGDTGVL